MEGAPAGLSDAIGIGQRPEVGAVKSIADEPRAVAGEAGRKVQETGRDVRELGREAGRDLRATDREAGQRVDAVGEEATGHVRRKKALVPILAVLAAGALAVWGILAFGRGPGPEPGVTNMQPRAPANQGQGEATEQGQPTEQGQATEQVQPTEPGQANENAGGAPAPGGTPTLNAPAGSPEADLERAVNDESVPLPYTAKLDKLTFDSGSSTLTPEATGPIGTAAAILDAHPSARVRVEGFADSTGDQAANQALSESRAAAVKDALEAKGVSGDRVEVAGHGVSASATNDTDQGRAFNRRAEIVVVSR
jgi:outer membrane protein OmpA-like peptidoglycan-associated protein